MTATANAASWEARHGLTPAQYQSAFTDLSKQGYRLKVISGYTSGGQERYAAVWNKTGGPEWAARHGLSSADYQKAFDDFSKKGFRLVYISGYAVSNQPQFAAIWEKSAGPAWTARHNLSSADYQKAFTDLAKQGYRLKVVSGYTVGGKDFYAGIWDKSAGPASTARHGLSAADYQKAFNDLGGQGYRLKMVSGYQVGGADRYAAIWEKTGGALSAARHGIKSNFYQGVFDNYYYQGYYPVYVNGFASGNASKLNAIWENTSWKGADLDLIKSKAQAYKSKHNLPGLSIAITKDGRLVYAAGFGEADQSSGEEVSPNHLFRIASVSKPITSVAVMRLLEQGKLSSLDKKVFGPNSILGPKYATPANNKKIDDITVRQLLQHVSGFTNAYGDPMFENTSYTHDQLINWALKNKVPINNPGSVYEYANFGYSVLGRVIEKESGQSYEAYVRNNVLNKAGITRMVIGANSQAARKPGEVVYYPSSAYNLNVTRFDAHGGWIATPIDLMRFMVRVDGLPTKPDIVNGTSHTTMTTKPGIMDKNGNDPNYAFGWVVGSGYQWHNGAMSGTLGLMAKAPNGYGYAALVNSRPSGDQFAGELKQMLDQIIAGVSDWPAYDLF
ncbi:MAG: serine hydrolase [Armatimonadota bacterium]|nr:serine hydrolase [Armatimonadota bacterium]